MNPCHPPTGLVRGPSYSTLLLPLLTMGFRNTQTQKHTSLHTAEVGLRGICIDHLSEFPPREEKTEMTWVQLAVS